MKSIKIGAMVALLLMLPLIGGSFLDKVKAIVIPITPEVLPELSNPGQKPGDWFYFLDIFAEDIHEFFIFNHENKALFQAERSLERIAEINALLEAEGIDAPGIAIAEEKIRVNMDRAARIIERQKAKGVEVTQLAKRLDSEFDIRQDLLDAVFDLEEARLEIREKEIKIMLRKAYLAEDFGKTKSLRIALIEIRDKKERIDIRKDFLEEILEIEEKKIELQMEAEERELEILAEKAKDLFDQKERELERIFEQRERAIELQEEALETQLREAILIEDIVLTNKTRAKLLNLEAEEKALGVEEGTLEQYLEQEKRGLRREIAMKERAIEQIKEAREEILSVRKGIVKMIEDGVIVAPPLAVLELISESESKMIVIEQAFELGNYGEVFVQAMAVEMLAKNAERILEEKEKATEKLEELKDGLEEANQSEEALRESQRRLERAAEKERKELKKELKEAREVHQERLEKTRRALEEADQAKERKKERETLIFCQTDVDCMGIFCPMVIGGDTPRCNVITGACYCGPSDDYVKNNKLKQYREYKDTERGAFYLNNLIKGLDKEMIGCIDKCLEEIKVAKTCAQNVTRDNAQELEKLLKNRLLVMMAAMRCSGEWSDARNCFQKTFCYQLFLDELREKDRALYRQYKELSPLLNF